MIGKLLRGRRRQESASSEPRTPRQESEEDAALAQDSLAASQQYDPALFSNIREQWVSRHMASRVDDYTARNPINVVAACCIFPFSLKTCAAKVSKCAYRPPKLSWAMTGRSL